MAAQMPDEIVRLTRELRRAREEIKRYGELLLAIQRSILPHQLPDVPGLDLAVHFADVDGPGGDYYDVRPVGPDHWAIVIADVSGHGLAAAAILALVHALGNAMQGQVVPAAPAAALTLINGPLATRYLADTGQFVTAFVSLFDARSQVLTYSSAGHPPLRLIRGNEVRRLDAASGLPMGIETTSEYRNEAVQLLAGDRLVLYTDGITESTNAAHERFGDPRLDTVLRRPASTAARLLDDVVTSVQTFRGGRPPDDDETCLVAMMKAGPAATPEPRK
jgi:sigma-B regulation protein RsbU (phosphoserine phosphatase)